jgi:hypothetical protein
MHMCLCKINETPENIDQIVKIDAHTQERRRQGHKVKLTRTLTPHSSQIPSSGKKGANVSASAAVVVLAAPSRAAPASPPTPPHPPSPVAASHAARRYI